MKDKYLPFANLGALDGESELLNAVVETPKGNRNKFKYDPTLGIFKFDKVLPAGSVFPFDYGFIPSTLGEDGDPLDVLVLMDEPAFSGCLIPARLIGVIEAEQTENGKTERNDRLLAVAAASQDHKDIKDIEQLNPELVKEIEHFFVSYDEMEGKQFRPLGSFGPPRARKLIDKGAKQYQKQKQSGKRKR